MTREVDQEYSGLASVYDARWKSYVDATVRETLARVTLQPGDRVLDVGCGTGVLLSAIARHDGSPRISGGGTQRVSPEVDPARSPGVSPGRPHTGRLVGIDPVAAMLAVARRRVGTAVHLDQGRAEQLPYQNGAFDIVLSTSVLHYVRQPVAAIREMARVLRPGGVLVITDWCADYLTMRMLDRYLRLAGSGHTMVYRTRECAQLFADAGLPPPRIDRYRISWRWGLMTAVGNKET